MHHHIIWAIWKFGWRRQTFSDQRQRFHDLTIFLHHLRCLIALLLLSQLQIFFSRAPSTVLFILIPSTFDFFILFIPPHFQQFFILLVISPHPSFKLELKLYHARLPCPTLHTRIRILCPSHYTALSVLYFSYYQLLQIASSNR